MYDLLLFVADRIAADQTMPGLGRRFYEALADELWAPTDREKFAKLMAVIGKKNWPQPESITGIGGQAELMGELEELLEGRQINWARLLYRPWRDRCFAPYRRLKEISPYKNREIKFFANGDTMFEQVKQARVGPMIDWLARDGALFSEEATEVNDERDGLRYTKWVVEYRIVGHV